MTEALALEFRAPTGETLRFEWQADELASLEPEPAAEPVWRLAGELDWDEIELVRVLSAHFDDGRLLAVAALRPAGAAGHGEELVAGAFGDLAASDLEQIDETLLSVEYDRTGDPRRVGLELHRAEGGIPLRAAGEAIAVARSREGQLEWISTALQFRLAGTAGTGRLDLLKRA
jgi:hypothetical protein